MRVRFHFHQDANGVAAGVTYKRPKLKRQLEELRERAFRDRLTGLPNAQAFEDELDRHRNTAPLSVLVLDFDGLRRANAAFGYTDGGDVLIAAVGQGLAALTRPGEYAARIHTAGDEFAVLMPKVGVDRARARAREVEAGLDALKVPQTHREVYGGASVGVATRKLGETPGQVLGRAIDDMRSRKLARSRAKRGRSKRRDRH